MNPVSKILFSILTILLAFSTGIVCWVFFKRLLLPYNSEGRYFDEDSVTVYHEQSVWIYGMLSFILLVLTLVAGYKTRNLLIQKEKL